MRYLLWCANAHVNFKVPELKALASLYNISIKWIEKQLEAPYVIVELNKEEDAVKLTSRSMLVRSCYELWGQAETVEEDLHDSIKASISRMKSHLKKDYRITINSFNRKLSKLEKYNKVLSFSYIPFEGKCNLTTPSLVLSLIEYYGVAAINIPKQPYKRFFGRWLIDGNREILSEYTLKKRSYIGTTSMDAELAFIMANLAQIGAGSITVDPFVGTGSILVSAAERGSYVWGWDINYMTIHALTKPTRVKQEKRAPGESILSNLSQYGLQNRYLDALVMDSSRRLWRNVQCIDAIITDLPYGLRESTERVGLKKSSSNHEENNKILTSGDFRENISTNHRSDGIVLINNESLEHLTNGFQSHLNLTNHDRTQKLNQSDKFFNIKNNFMQSEEVKLDFSQSNTSKSNIQQPEDSYDTNINNIHQSEKNLHNFNQSENNLHNFNQSETPDKVTKSLHELFPEHYPPKINYDIADIVEDLLNFAASFLRIGGRLVYWIPVFREDYSDDVVPKHPCLNLEYNCEQILSTYSSRRLITAVKIREPTENDCACAKKLRKMEEFKLRFAQNVATVQSMTKLERKQMKKKFRTDKRGQGYVPMDELIAQSEDANS